MKPTLLIYCKGLAMGAADLVPGISGGTMALITGIYERLICSIRDITTIAQTIIERPFSPSTWNQAIKSVDWKLFLPLAFGIISAILIGAHFIHMLIEMQPGALFSFFTGLIIASVVLFLGKVKHKTTTVVAGIIGIVIGVALSILPGAAASNPSLLNIFGSGLIAAIAMILPGISGSHILLTIGYYEYIISLVRDPFAHMLEILVFAIGAICSILFGARLIAKFMQKYHDVALTLLTGIMAGSLIRPISIVHDAGSHPGIVALFLLLGVAIVMLLSRFSAPTETIIAK